MKARLGSGTTRFVSGSFFMANPTVIFDPNAADVRRVVQRMVDPHNVAIT
jgi:hypothetical protein